MSWPSGLGNYFVYKRFTVQTLLWSLEFVIQTNLEHVTITVWNLAWSWSILTFKLCEFVSTSKNSGYFTDLSWGYGWWKNPAIWLAENIFIHISGTKISSNMGSVLEHSMLASDFWNENSRTIQEHLNNISNFFKNKRDVQNIITIDFKVF